MNRIFIIIKRLVVFYTCTRSSEPPVTITTINPILSITWSCMSNTNLTMISVETADAAVRVAEALVAEARVGDHKYNES